MRPSVFFAHGRPMQALAQRYDDEPAHVLVDGIGHAGIGMSSVVFGGMR